MYRSYHKGKLATTKKYQVVANAQNKKIKVGFVFINKFGKRQFQAITIHPEQPQNKSLTYG